MMITDACFKTVSLFPDGMCAGQVVQRVQRYGRNCLLRRSLLSLMVSELMHDDDIEPQGESGSQENRPAAAQARSYEYDDKGRPLMDSPNARAMMSVLKRLNVRGETEVSRSDLAKVCIRKDLGFRVPMHGHAGVY